MNIIQVSHDDDDDDEEEEEEEEEEFPWLHATPCLIIQKESISSSSSKSITSTYTSKLVLELTKTFFIQTNNNSFPMHTQKT